MVADGMGGHNAGDVAGKMGCEKITYYFKQHTDTINTSEDVKRLMFESIRGK